MNQEHTLRELLLHANPHPVLPPHLLQEPVAVLDFSAANPRLHQVDLADTAAFVRFVEQELALQNARVGAGGYNEDRLIYGSPVFTSAGEPRTVHLGIDLWTAAGTPVLAPLPGLIHSFADNSSYRDYGPTLVLEHRLQEQRFYTLYGHLSRSSMSGWQVGAQVQAGQQIATLGAPEENVQWPPHLHFQLITDLLGRAGDFFGVAPASERGYYLSLCPNPNLLLRLPQLPL